MQHLVEQKDTRYSKNRFWRRARIVPVMLTIVAFGTQFTVGRIEARVKQNEIDEQRTQLARIAGNVEALVVRGKLTPDDARRIFVVMSETLQPKEQLGIKVIPPKQ